MPDPTKPKRGWFADHVRSQLPGEAPDATSAVLKAARPKAATAADYVRATRQAAGGAVASLGDIPLALTPRGAVHLPDFLKKGIQAAGDAIAGGAPENVSDESFRQIGSVAPFVLPYGKLGQVAEAAATRAGITETGQLIKALSKEGGATLDKAGNAFRGSGYAVADPALTARVSSPAEMRAFLARPDVQKALAEGKQVGKWTDPATGITEINITDVVPKHSTAQKLGRARGELALGELKNGEYKGDVPVAHPEGMPNEGVRDAAAAYNQGAGLGRPEFFRPVEHDQGLSKDIAAWYEGAANNPNDPAVKNAYEAFNRETHAQFEHLKKQGWTFEPAVDPVHDTYASAEDMRRAAAHKTLKVFTGGEPNALMTPQQNFEFRAVHDVMAHTGEGYEFHPNGEWNAALKHSQMYSPEAQKALFTETVGQNANLNYGPNGEFNRANMGNEIFPVQKATLLPDNFIQRLHEIRDKATGAMLPGGPAPLREPVAPGGHLAATDLPDYRAPRVYTARTGAPAAQPGGLSPQENEEYNRLLRRHESGDFGPGGMWMDPEDMDRLKELHSRQGAPIPGAPAMGPRPGRALGSMADDIRAESFTEAHNDIPSLRAKGLSVTREADGTAAIRDQQGNLYATGARPADAMANLTLRRGGLAPNPGSAQAAQAPEQIVGAAYQNLKDANGNHIVRDSHAAVRSAAKDAGIKDGYLESQSGFVTNRGRFVPRIEAKSIAKQAGQITKSTAVFPELHASDIAESPFLLAEDLKSPEARAAYRERLKQGLAIPGPWQPTSRGVFPRDVAPIQGTAPIDPRLAASMPRGEPSELAQAVADSKVVERGLQGDIEKGLPLGGDIWYEGAPIKASFDAIGGPFSFHDFNLARGSSSIQAPTHLEIPTATGLLFGRRQGLNSLAEIKAAHQAMYPKEPSLWGTDKGTFPNYLRALENDAQLPQTPGSAERKVSWYTHGNEGGSLGADVAIDKHEGRRLLQLAWTDRRIRPLLKELGFTAETATGPRADVLPIKNALDYTLVSSPYRRLADRMGLASSEQAQAGRWIGGGPLTGLKSQPTGDFTQTLEDVLMHTANVRGLSTDPAGLNSLWERAATGQDILAPIYGNDPLRYLYSGQVRLF